MSVTLRAALADYPHVLALKDGSVRSDEITFEWETVQPITRAFRRMVRTGDFDLCEIALTTHAQVLRSSAARSVSVARRAHNGYAKFGAPLIVPPYREMARSHLIGSSANWPGGITTHG